MREIPLTQGKVALVDDADYEALSQHNWHVDAGGYARYNQHVRLGVYQYKRIPKLMHREVLKPPKGVTVDHVNGNTLDNRKQNLRQATMEQQSWNKKTYKGRPFKGTVRDYKRKDKWRGQIKVKGHLIHLGFFDRRVDAAKAYNEAATKYFGAYARLNVIPEES